MEEVGLWRYIRPVLRSSSESGSCELQGEDLLNEMAVGKELTSIETVPESHDKGE